MKEYKVEHFYRDQRLLEIGEGTSEIQRMGEWPEHRRGRKSHLQGLGTGGERKSEMERTKPKKSPSKAAGKKKPRPRRVKAGDFITDAIDTAPTGAAAGRSRRRSRASESGSVRRARCVTSPSRI